MKKTIIELKNVTKEFSGNIVLKGIDLEIFQNEFVTLLGPSGCGKTTLLRIIGGFIEPSSGDVLFNGESVIGLPAHKRMTNTVFQRYALFPHLDVFENIAFGLRVKSTKEKNKIKIKHLTDEYTRKIQLAKGKDEKIALRKELQDRVKIIKDENYFRKEEIKRLKEELKLLNKKDEKYKEERKDLKDRIKAIRSNFANRKTRERDLEIKVRKYLKMVSLEGFEERSIDNLSGGQQQRVAIARALINQPEVLLLDEPLAALDLKMRQEMQYELKELQEEAGISFIYVTHDQEEALTMSDKIVVMNDGEIQQIGTPEQIYNEPANNFVANFIGESNIIPAIMKKDFLVEFDGKEYKCDYSGFDKDEKVEVVLRPEDLEIKEKDKGFFNGKVSSVAFKGVYYEIDVDTKYRTFTIHTTDYYPLDSVVSILFEPKDDIHVMEIE